MTSSLETLHASEVPVTAPETDSKTALVIPRIPTTLTLAPPVRRTPSRQGLRKFVRARAGVAALMMALISPSARCQSLLNYRDEPWALI